MQSRFTFFKGIYVLLAVFCLGLAFAESSYAQRGGGGRPDSGGGGSRGGGAPSASPGGGRPSFSPSGGSGSRPTAPPSSPQPSRSFAPPSSPQPRMTPPAPVARSGGDRPAPSTFRAPAPAPRPATPSVGQSRPTTPSVSQPRPATPSITQTLPSQSILRAQQPSQRPSGGASPSRPERPTATTAPSRGETQRPTPPIAGGNTQRPTPPIAGGNTQRPTPPIAGGSTQRPTPPIAGGSTQRPTPPIAGGSTQRPTPPIAGGGTQRPTPPVTGGSTQRPTPPVAGGGTQRPTPPIAGGNTQRPAPGTTPRQSGGSDQPTFAPREPGRGPEGRPTTRAESTYIERRTPTDRPTGMPPRGGNDRPNGGTARIPSGRPDTSRSNEPIYRGGDSRNRPGGGIPQDRRPVISPSVRPNGAPPPRQFAPSRTMIYDVQRHFNGYDRYWTNDWYHRHPGSWHPTYIPPTRWWYRPSWHDTWSWYGPGFFAGFILGSATTPYPYYPYYYGNNIVYRGNMVYVNGTPYVSAADYYAQALVLAQASESVIVVEQPVIVEQAVTEPIQLPEGPILEPPTPEEMQQMVAKPVQNGETEEWLPMGTFALLDDVTQGESDMILQLATNKSGQLRGNFVNEATGETVRIHGAVDPKSQRVAFQFDGDDQTVLECGLWNLTQDSVPLLIHFDEERTEQKTLIRLTQDDETPEDDEELAP